MNSVFTSALQQRRWICEIASTDAQSWVNHNQHVTDKLQVCLPQEWRKGGGGGGTGEQGEKGLCAQSWVNHNCHVTDKLQVCMYVALEAIVKKIIVSGHCLLLK